MAKLPIETLIEKMHFKDSKNLVYKSGFIKLEISKHDIKTLNEIKPFAAYFVNNKPFILFVESSFTETDMQYISKLIWNSQIPLAFVCDERTVKVFNGKSIEFSTKLLEEISTNSLDDISEESDFSYYKISDPLFWDKHSKQYSKLQLNDYLLQNISSLTNELKKKYKVEFATKLVLRLIFIRYLIDRGVDLDYKNFSNNISNSQQALLNVTNSKVALYNLFKHLKDKFNGNLFELGNEINDDALTDDIFTLLSDFLAGNVSIGTGQMSLFAMYDFKIIPVELISNIYEILLGKELRAKDNAFYTPNYLAEYILDKATLGVLKNDKHYKILDPSCGSGIFLVNSFRRMIDANIGENLFCDDDKLLRDIVESNIYGIDINEAAIDVTIFSLYLTILDYKDPKTLSEFKLPNLKNKNLIVSDFFDDSKLKSLQEVEFDFIIGNPPWGSVSNGLHMEYCEKNGHRERQQNKEICRSFVFRAKDFSCKKTVCSFILHSKILYTQKEPSKKFREFLLRESKILNIVEMSSVRKLVFKNANAPATVVTFKYCDADNNLQNKIVYTSLKPNMFFKLFNIIVVEKYDVKYIPQNLLFENDWAWKTIVYGFSQDIDNINFLKSRYKSINQVIKENKLVFGRGIEVHDGDEQDTTHLKGRPLINAKLGIDPYYINLEKSIIFAKDAIHRAKINRQEIFKAPFAIIKKGFNTKTYKYRSAYSEQDFLYPDAVTGICGDENSKTTLLSLVGVLNSSVYAYLNLMLGSSSGIEREQGFPTEIFRYPVTENEDLARRVSELQQEIKSEKETLFVYDSNHKILINQLDELVIESFQLSDNTFVDYTLNIQIPELTNSKEVDIYRGVTVEDLENYSECFKKQFTSIYNKVEKGISIKYYPKVLNRFTVFELEITDDNTNLVSVIWDVIDANKIRFTNIIRHDYNDLFHQIRDVIHFAENSFYIIKPNNYKYWHPAISEMDLADVLDQILSDDGGEE